MGKRKLVDFRYLIHTLLLLLPIMFVLPFYSTDTYSIIKNTTSHLGAQSTPNAWIMNAAFVVVGIAFVHIDSPSETEYAWKLSNIKKIENDDYIKGQLGLWNIKDFKIRGIS